MEPETFNNPLFDATKGKNWHLQYTGDTAGVSKHPLFQLATRNSPRSDFEAIQAACPKEAEGIDLSFHLAYNAWSNPICNLCWEKSNPSALFPCEECGLTFYCSVEHQLEHKAKHSLRCCKADGPLGDGPMALVVLKATISE